MSQVGIISVISLSIYLVLALPCSLLMWVFGTPDDIRVVDSST